ncbi:MAG: class I SAM-dependent methyltransferase [Desulfamplus sp.]|nr:class I SAM-dependent methyltransferase [Desulfamplus sp.]
MDYYDKNTEQFTESTINVDMGEIYKEFFAHLKKGATLLDAGCGPGRDTLEFLTRGYLVEAFDKSRTMAETARKKTGINVQCSTFEKFRGSDRFDGVWCCASLLHVPMQDLGSTIEKLFHTLKSKGIIYMSFKYGEGERWEQGRHFTYLTESSLAGITGKIRGMEEIRIWITDDLRPGRTDKWLNAIYKHP